MRRVFCACRLTSTSFPDRPPTLLSQRGRPPKPIKYRIVRPRSPQAPRQFDLTDPQLLRNLRLFLAQAAARPPGYSLELEELVARKLDVSTTVLDHLLCEGLASQQQALTDAHLLEVEAGEYFHSSTMAVVYHSFGNALQMAARNGVGLAFLHSYACMREQQQYPHQFYLHTSAEYNI